MKTILIIGSIVVTSALIAYTIGIFTEQRIKRITPFVLFFLSLGLLLDSTATVCMIIGSSNSPFTFHGFIGYSGLLAMIIENYLAYKFYFANSSTTQVPKGLHLYSRFAFVFWVLVYITGALLVALK
ncbi:MAG: hypothetical protein M0P66_03250 [Salinivirgaceae bacterium]|nr:hypothetical protein [Salinivirgaceae bacterium]